MILPEKFTYCRRYTNTQTSYYQIFKTISYPAFNRQFFLLYTPLSEAITVLYP